ncbi:MAG: TetR family transcriptional regulator [Sphingobium sp.]
MEEGYAAVSGRKVAARAGLNASLIHYYFPTSDDLLVAAYRRCRTEPHTPSGRGTIG